MRVPGGGGADSGAELAGYRPYGSGRFLSAALPAEPPLWVGLLCVAVMLPLSMMWYTLLAWMLSGQRSSALYLRGQHWVDRAAGAVFIGFGVRLATGR